MESRPKIILCLFFFFSFNSHVLCQDNYFVTFIKGEIKRTNATKIKVGDQLLAGEKLIFSQKDGKLILLHPQKGRFIVEPGQEQPRPSGEYLIYLTKSMVPATQRLKLSSRGNADLEEYFRADPSINRNLLFIGETSIGLDNSKYPIKDPDNDFFFLQYTPVHGKPTNNKLTIRNDSMLISKTDLLFNGRLPAGGGEVKLEFTRNDTNGKKITKISFFKPLFMSLEECKDMMRAIRQTLGDHKGKVIEETMTQLYYNYGKPDKVTVNKIYDSL